MRVRLKEGLSESDILVAFKTYVENLTEMQNGLMEQLQQMKESVLKKMGNFK